MSRRQAMLWSTIFATIALLSWTGATSVRADSLVQMDPNDSAGRLDVKNLAHGHSRDRIRVRHVVSTREGWTKRAFSARGTLRLVFSVSGDNCAEAEVVVDVHRGEWRARWRSYDPLGCGQHDDNGGFGEFQGDLAIRKTSRRRVVIAIPRDLFGVRTDDYRWAVTTTWTCKDPCGDNAPNRGNGDRASILHDL